MPNRTRAFRHKAAVGKDHGCFLERRIEANFEEQGEEHHDDDGESVIDNAKIPVEEAEMLE